jgi:adenosine deaminase
MKNSRIFGLPAPLAVVLAALIATGCATALDMTKDPVGGIRNNRAKLQYFFTQMPKGGDLHNHLSGSAYAETYFAIAVDEEMYLDAQTYKLYLQGEPRPAQAIQLRADMPNLHSIRVQCIDHWSVRNYEQISKTLPPDEFFFDTFEIFSGAADTAASEVTLLKEVRQRAADENVSYLEIMFSSPSVSASAYYNDSVWNNKLKELIQAKNSSAVHSLLNEIWNAWELNAAVQRDIADYIQRINYVHNEAAGVAPEIISLYQTCCHRNSEPLNVFAQLYIGFNACAQAPLLVGVNIVSAENGEISLRDYWGHMEMFKYSKAKIPSVKTSMHAGELCLGLTPPEDLKFHIAAALFQSGADRIGHGVDIAFETDAKQTLKYMADNGVPVEINLTSNEFILGIKDGEHPIMLYRDNGVPIILSTDDPGILRSNLTDQYVLAAERYGELGYKDFKQFARNSISYSFLPDLEKENLIVDLNKRFLRFEQDMGIKTR